jgi:hypothetical protein
LATGNFVQIRRVVSSPDLVVIPNRLEQNAGENLNHRERLALMVEIHLGAKRDRQDSRFSPTLHRVQRNRFAPSKEARLSAGLCRQTMQAIAKLPRTPAAKNSAKSINRNVYAL